MARDVTVDVVAVDRTRVAELLQSTGFTRRTTTIMTVDAVDAAEHGYDSLLLAISRKP